MAAGGFVSRAFEAMLKESSGRKYPDLRKAIQTYQDGTEKVNQQPKSAEGNQTASSAGDGSSPETEGVDEKLEVEAEQSSTTQHAAEAEHGGRPAVVTRIITTTLANVGYTLDGAEAELVLNPLRLAFDTKNMKIFEPALDCLHKLIAYDHLEGDPGLDCGKNAPMFTDILNMVCNCVHSSSSDSTTLQVLKVLLTAVSSTKFRVHGEPLLEVIRVCYNIALNSKSPMNQATSKAMLTQMISIIFRRMEDDPVCTLSILPAHTRTVPVTSKVEEISSGDQNEKVKISGDAPIQVKDTDLASLEELHSLVAGADIKGLDSALDKAVHFEDGKTIVRGIELESMSIAQRDALLVFRTICKMGMKEGTDEVTAKTRVLSLEILQGLLEGVSHSFTKNFHFIDSVKAHIAHALLRASVSQSPVIFQYATGIFSVLLQRFRESLKDEIGIIFPVIVLRSLDVSECPINNKISILRLLEKLSKDPQMLVDVFVYYDCDLEAPNLFERMVKTLSKMAQGSQYTDLSSVASTQTVLIKDSSLQCLVNVLKSLVDWETSQRESEKSRKSNQSNEQENSARGTAEIRSKEDDPSNFEKAMDHKSTNEDVISEAMIGDYMGNNEEFPLAPMHAYVDSVNFSGMKFDVAIREFLEGFQLPGEAQKIDRIMEKFAERYCADNPGLFKNADTAYVLAYAVIMLNTDAHNRMVWPKMTMSDFTRMSAMNDPEDSAPTELLEDMYNSIVKRELKLKCDTIRIEESSKQKPEDAERGRLVSILNLALHKRISSSDAKSGSEAIVKQTHPTFQKEGGKSGDFYTAEQIELVRPMVEAVGWPLLATFSVTMEESENNPKVILCLEGFKAGIHMTYALGMDTMRYAFLTSLIRFTFLHAPKEMRSKNVEALLTLLALCDLKPENLQDTWHAALECVSRLEFITSTPAVTATVMLGSNQISRDAVLQSLKELAGKYSEQIFVNSVKLPSDSIVEFFTALCEVSAEELKQIPPRVFCLQKVVEIGYYNMARIRMVWARLWSVLANHLIAAGNHHDEKIATYAIDSLRQLGMKYLECAELTKFTFQNDILKPFVVLMRNSRSETIRNLIVDCIVQMIKSKVGSIRSGWRGVFMVFTAAADDELESIVEKSFENVEHVILEHFNQVVGDCFMDCVNCLIGFANNKASALISLKAIALLRICENRLAEGLVSGGVLKPVKMNVDATFDVTEHYWFPMLAGLSDLTSDSRPKVRNCALEVLFDLLNERGKKFSAPFWESIFHRVLFPIFDQVRQAGKESLISSGDEMFRETSIHSLQLLCNLFNIFYKEVCFMLPQLLSLLLDCAKKTDQTVVSISLGALVHLIEVGGHQFNENDWEMLLKSIRDASYTTQPLELLNSMGFDNPNNSTMLIKDIEIDSVKSIPDTEVDNHLSPVGDKSASLDDNQELGFQSQLDGTEDVPSPKGTTQKPAEAGDLGRSQTFGQRIMDNLFLRSLTSKPKTSTTDISTPNIPPKLSNAVDPDVVEEESPLMGTIRGKCTTQLLLLGAIDSIQRKYWTNLKASQKIAVMDILLSLLEFAASYNSDSNLRLRMHSIPSGRPPLNLLRQETAGIGIYMDVLQKTTSGFDTNGNHHLESSGSFDFDVSSEKNDSNIIGHSDMEERLEGIAEEKLVSFCEQVLKEASSRQSSVGETTNMDIHRVLELRSPVTVKVLRSMCFMNNKVFRKHMREFYPLLTKLVCCDQGHERIYVIPKFDPLLSRELYQEMTMDIRRALADLFRVQLKALLP